MSDRCRVCLDEALKLYPLNGHILNCDQDINTMIKYCTSIEVEVGEESDMPQGVCVPCFKTLRIAYNFIVQFKENHEKLLQERENLFSMMQNENELPVEEEVEDTDMAVMEAEVIQNYALKEKSQSVKETEEDGMKYEILEEQEITEQSNEIEDEEVYEYQEVEVENLGDFLNSLDESGTSTNSENYQPNVKVKVIKAEPPPGDYNSKPHTVLRRKIKIRFSCPLCPSLFFASFENGLLPHMSLHCETFRCNVCVDSTLYNSDSFLNHFMKCHRYQCPYCGKSFNRTGTLTSHIKTHSNFRYNCSAEGCTKSFPTSWTLKKHEAVHSSHSAYFCNECNLDFKTYDTYMYHQKKHAGKKFLCMCCGRTFMQSVHLKYHMQQHTGIKHFKCDMCIKGYTSSSQLKKHKKRHHPEQIQNVWVEPVEVDQEFENVI